MDLIKWTRDQKESKKFNMKKLMIFIFSVIIWILVLYSFYYYDSIKQTKEKMEKVATFLCESITDNKSYNAIKLLRKADGTELSFEEYDNYLVNSGLYKIKFIGEYNEDSIHFSKPRVNLISRKSGSITISFTTVSGENVSLTLNYWKDGIFEYFVVEDYGTPDKEWVKLEVPFDVKFFDETLSQSVKVNATGHLEGVYDMYVEDGILYLSYITEVKDNMIASLDGILIKCEEQLKVHNPAYRIEVNEEKNAVNVYYDRSVEESMMGTNIRMLLFDYALMNQVLNGNLDWHFDLYYYDYQTEELLKHYNIR